MRYFGKIKWFNTTKRYGFIVPDDGGGQVFIFPPEASFDFVEGQSVEFECRMLQSSKFEAVNITIVD